MAGAGYWTPPAHRLLDWTDKKGSGRMINRFKSWGERFLARLVNGDEPQVVVWLVSAAVAVAAKYGFDLPAEVIWTFLAISFPAMATARNKVDPSENKQSWLDVLKRIPSVEPDIELDPDFDAGPAGVIDLGDVDPDGQPLWLEEHFPEYAYAGPGGGEDA